MSKKTDYGKVNYVLEKVAAGQGVAKSTVARAQTALALMKHNADMKAAAENTASWLRSDLAIAQDAGAGFMRERDEARQRAEVAEARAARLEAADAAWQRAIQIEKDVADKLCEQNETLVGQRDALKRQLDEARMRADVAESKNLRLIDESQAAAARAAMLELDARQRAQPAVVEIHGPARVRAGISDFNVFSNGISIRQVRAGDRIKVEFDADAVTVRQALHVIGQALGVRP